MGKTIKIGGELESVASGGIVADAGAIRAGEGKTQSVVNSEVDNDLNAPAAQGGLKARMTAVEQLGQIEISGGQATIATAADFNNPTDAQKAYIPTVGAILDGADDEPVAGSSNLVKSGGVYDGISNVGLYVTGISGLKIENWYIDGSNKWQNTNYYQSVIIPIKGGETIAVTGNGVTPSFICFLKTYNPVNNTIPNYSSQTDYNSRIEINKYSSVEYVVPSDANYLYLYLKNTDTGIIYTPKEISINGYNVNSKLTNVLSEIQENYSLLANDVKNQILNTIGGFNSDYVRQCYIDSSDKWVIDEVYRSIFIPIPKNSNITIESNANVDTFIAFLKNKEGIAQSGTPAFSSYSGFTGRISILRNTTVNYVSPDDVNYLFVYLENTNTYSFTPQSVSVNGVNITKSVQDIYEIILEDIDNSIVNTYNVVAGLNNDSFNCYISSGNKWVVNDVYKSVFIKLGKNAAVKITGNKQRPSQIAFLKNTTYSNNSTPAFSTVEGFTEKISIPANTTLEYISPDDAKYLFVYIENIETYVFTPSALYINGVDMCVVNEMSEFHNEINQVNSKFDDIDKTPLYRAYHNGGIAHLFINTIGNIDLANANLIPSQSIYDIRISKRLGYGGIEANVHRTKDGKYVTMHGVSGTLGHEVYSINENYNVSMQFSDLTFDEIRNNFRYRSASEKYRTRITSLDEFLLECHIQGMIPMVQIADSGVEEICKKYCGNDYVAYNGNRNNGFTGVIFNWNNPQESKDAVIAKCDLYGAPFIYGGNVDNATLTMEELKEIAEAVHEKNCLITAGYISTVQKEIDLHNIGFDFFYPTVVGDLYSLCSLGSDYSDFSYNGTVVNGVLQLASGNTISLPGTITSVKLASARLNIKFNGRISYKFSTTDSDTIISSDGINSVNLFTYFLNKQVNLIITAIDATEIYEIDFQVQKR